MKTKLHSAFIILHSAFFLLLAIPPAPAQTGFGSALSFDGVDDYVSVPLTLPDTGTIEMWYYVKPFYNYQELFDNSINPNDWEMWIYSSGQISFRIDSNEPATNRPNYTLAAPNSWHHFAVTWQKHGTNVDSALCVDGVLQSSFTNEVWAAPGSTFYLAGGNPGNTKANGQMDEVRIWNVARSQTVISNNMYHPLTGTEAGLVAYWRFDEAGGTTAYDATTNHFNGTLMNRPVRVPSVWAPEITLNSPDPFTNECHVPFLDPTTISAAPVAIAAGAFHSLALKADDTVIGWGDNRDNQTNSPVSATNVVAIAAGYYYSLALKADGSVVGWGDNEYGQTNTPASATNVVAIAAGSYHSLALKADGTVVGWGYNQSGQATGVPNNISPYTSTGFVAVAGQTLTNVVAIAAGYSHSLALKADGSVVGWGYSQYGQTNSPASLNILNLPMTKNGTVDVNSPRSYSLTYSTTNALGAVGTAIRTVVVVDTLPPVLTLLGANPLMLALGATFVEPSVTATDLCGGVLTGSIISNITVISNIPGIYTNTYTVTDASANTARATRTVVVGAPVVTTLPATNLLNDTATLNGTVNPGGSATVAWFEWGTSVGYENTTGPVKVGSGTSPVAVNASLSGLTPGVTYHYRVVATNSPWVARGADQVFWSPAVDLNGPAFLTWQYGMPFVDPTTVNASPLAIAAGNSHSLALKADGTVVGWGAGTFVANPDDGNDYGQALVPVGLSDVVAIAAGGGHSLALQADGSVVGWGAGGPGTSGDSNYGQTTIPASATNVVAIAAGFFHSLALKADGSVVGWGAGTFVAVPPDYVNCGQVMIPASATNVVAIAAGLIHSLALKADGTVVDWGWNGDNQTNVPGGLDILNLPPAVSGTMNANVLGTYVLTYSATAIPQECEKWLEMFSGPATRQVNEKPKTSNRVKTHHCPSALQLYSQPLSAQVSSGDWRR